MGGVRKRVRRIEGVNDHSIINDYCSRQHKLPITGSQTRFQSPYSAIFIGTKVVTDVNFGGEVFTIYDNDDGTLSCHMSQTMSFTQE